MPQPGKPAAAGASQAPAAPSASTASAPDLSRGIAENSSTDFLRASESLPTSTPALVAVLTARHDEVKGLLDRGQLGAIYVPALLGKDAALRLDEHVNELPVQARVAVSDAVRRLVLAAWQLDSYGDLGDQVKVTQAYERFAAAVTTIVSAYAPK